MLIVRSVKKKEQKYLIFHVDKPRKFSLTPSPLFSKIMTAKDYSVLLSTHTLSPKKSYFPQYRCISNSIGSSHCIKYFLMGLGNEMFV